MPRKKLLLVGWDSADWKIIHPLLDAGLMPGVAALVARGASGNLATLEPQLSPMLWTSIATGKMAYHHGVHGFTEIDPESGAIVPVSAATRRCKTVWEMLGERGLRSHVIGWFATQGERATAANIVADSFPLEAPVDRKSAPADWPPPPAGTYWPEALADSLDQLRVAPHEVDGEEIIRLFVPEAPSIDQRRDPRLGHLAKHLAATYSIHAAATHLMESDPDWDFTAIYYRAIDEISHEFMPYHPPRMDGVPERDFEIYRNVVAMTYRTHDLMLQRLVALAGPDATVLLISDHGFHSDSLRPRHTPDVPAGITAWHRGQGMFAAAGPEIRADELVHGARLLDVAPTVLHHFGLPVGGDFEGRVLREIFANPQPVARIPSWETNGVARPEAARCVSDSQAIVERFAALGYIDGAQNSPGEAAASTLRENRWNLARALLHTGRTAEALPLLEECFYEVPERNDFACQLASAQLQLGLADEAEETLGIVLESLAEAPLARLLMGAVHLEKGNPRAAIADLELAQAAHPDDPQLLRLFARCHVFLRQWDAAEAAARRILALDADDFRARIVLCRVNLARGNAEAAAALALEAIGLEYGNPQPHLLLAAALLHSEEFPEAEIALRNHLSLSPRSPRGHRMMARVLAKLHRADEANEFLGKSRLLAAMENRGHDSESLAALRVEVADRAEARRISRAEMRRNAPAAGPELPPTEFVIVSGLPRSGTSLMMQILTAGGMQPMTDRLREADEDNPEGYWEWEPVKSLAANPNVIDQAAGKVIKIVSSQLAHLPSRHRYRIVFLMRPVSEVADSQLAMLRRRDPAAAQDRPGMVAALRRHRDGLVKSLRRAPSVALLEVDFHALADSPAAEIQRLRDFLGPALAGSTDAMIAAIRPELVRHRSADESV